MSQQRKVIILLGPPGSGKGTQAVRLAKQLNIPHISTGDLFRENLSKQTDLGKKVKTFMDSGHLVPDELVLDMLFDRVSKQDCVAGYLLDGFPRTIPQAQSFDAHLSPNDELIVLNLDVADDVIIKRIAGRLSCKSCGAIQHKDFSPPKVEGKCDKCGGELFQRPDDKPEVVKERLRVYHTQTKPLIEYYAKKNVLHTVNGEQTPDTVAQELTVILT
jgi:adenylate kinase